MSPTRAAIQARADALTDAEIARICSAADRDGDRLLSALACIAAGWGRRCLEGDEVPALRQSPHRHIRKAGARRILAARLLSEGR